MNANVATIEYGPLEQTIIHGLNAHVEWKQKLHSAIATGVTDISVAAATADDQCSLGRWLHEDVPWMVRKTWDYTNVRRRHAEFHVQAGNVLSMATGGQPAEAIGAMAPGSSFSTAAERLEFGLRDWLTCVEGQAAGTLH